jgi:hypothetical protein
MTTLFIAIALATIAGQVTGYAIYLAMVRIVERKDKQ